MISLTKTSNKPHRRATEEFIPPTYKLENVSGRRGIELYPSVDILFIPLQSLPEKAVLLFTSLTYIFYIMAILS